jgi:hypothetical protein
MSEEYWLFSTVEGSVKLRVWLLSSTELINLFSVRCGSRTSCLDLLTI